MSKPSKTLKNRNPVAKYAHVAGAKSVVISDKKRVKKKGYVKYPYQKYE